MGNSKERDNHFQVNELKINTSGKHFQSSAPTGADKKPSSSLLNRLPLSGKASRILQPHHPVNENMREVWQRLDGLDQRQSQFTCGGPDLVASGEAVAAYLSENHCEVSKATERLMVQLDLATADVHHALPYGRGNVLVRAEDGTIDQALTTKKVHLSELTDWLTRSSPAWKKNQTVPEVTVAARRSACAIVAGSGTCAHYTWLLMLMAVDICEKNKHSFASPPTLTFCHEPVMEGKRINHAWLELAFTEAESGKEITLALDPWGANNRPVLREHSAYREGKTFLSLECGNQAQDYRRVLKDNVKTLQPMLRQILRDEGFHRRVQDRLDELPQDEEAANGHYSLANSYNGFVDHDALKNTHQQVIDAPERRPTPIPGHDSVLAKRIAEKIHKQSVRSTGDDEK